MSHIREVDAIVHLLRCFDAKDIQNVNKTVDPVRDLEIIETELMLADIESLEKRLDKKKKVKKLIVYAFSSENWSREKFEVNSLMNLISFGTEVKLDEIIKNEVRMEFIGNLDSIPKKAKEEVDRCVRSTKNFSDFTLVIALNLSLIHI